MRILILVPELHGNAIVRVRKQLFAEPIRFLPLPFRSEEIDDGGRAGEKGVAITPDRVWSVCGGDFGRVSRRTGKKGRVCCQLFLVWVV